MIQIFTFFHSGLGVLKNGKFSQDTIMPICLPKNEKFKDTDREGITVGFGATAPE